MGILDRLFGRKEDEGAAAVAERPIEEECPHGSMTPRWENAEEMGKMELVSYYVCEGCGIKLSREESERAMATAGEALRIDESLRKTVEEEAADVAEEEKRLP